MAKSKQKLHRKHPEIYPYSKYTTHVPIFWLLATLLRDLLIFLAGILYFFKFEPYFLTGTLGDAFYTFAKTLNIFLYDMLTWFLSFGAFLSFVCIMQYLKYFPKFYVTVLGLFNGIKHILKVIIGQLPLFIGFILTGTLWFGSYAVVCWNFLLFFVKKCVFNNSFNQKSISKQSVKLLSQFLQLLLGSFFSSLFFVKKKPILTQFFS